MPILAQFRCLNCGQRFETQILERGEKQDYERENRPTSPVHCPKCNRTDVETGWG